jgi:hypothetical protein
LFGSGTTMSFTLLEMLLAVKKLTNHYREPAWR